MMPGLLGLLGLLWMAPPCETGLCMCAEPPTAAEERNQASAVFTGTVVSVRDTVIAEGGEYGYWGPRRVLMRVDRAWKGVESDTVVVLTHRSDGMCGFPFRRGRAYLVFAYRAPEGPLTAGICGRTASLRRARADVRALGEPERRWRE